MQLKPKGYSLSDNIFGFLIGVTKLQCLIDQAVHALQKGTVELKNGFSFLILLKSAMIRS